MKKNLILPGLWENQQFIIPLLSYYKQNPLCFYDDIVFNAVFGNFTHTIWDGGRTSNISRQYAYIEDIELIIEIYNNILNIPLRLVCSNPLIQPLDCYDKFSNLILKLCENYLNSIIIRSEILKNYIQDKYPKYSFISSTTKCLNNNDLIIKELSNSDYIYVCLPYNKNFDLNFLKSIPEPLKQKIELLINEKCYINCPNRELHYIEISKSNYLYNNYYTNAFHCSNTSLKTLEQNSIITYSQLNTYLSLNINHFKLEGRAEINPNVTLLNILSYCVKPLWQLLMFKAISDYMNDFNIYNYKLENYKLF